MNVEKRIVNSECFFYWRWEMLNKIWPWIVIISVVFAVVAGNIYIVNECIFSSLKSTTELAISLVGIICFWNGMIKILLNTSLIEKIKKVLNPIINKIYSDESDRTKELIAVNMASNMMGIGNAATPAGLGVVDNMEKEHNGKNMTKSMNLFILMNCLSIQVLPNTIVSIRMAQGDGNVGGVLFSIWIVSIIIFIIIMGVGYCLFQE